jgi:hypothetical protein
MPVAGYKDRIEQNVTGSDGTVIISHGDLTGGADYSLKMAEKHKRPVLQIDLKKMPIDSAPAKMNTWITDNNIEILNVAGSRTNEDSNIYKDTMCIIEDVILLTLVNAKPGEHLADVDRKKLLDKLLIPPHTVDEAVDQLIMGLDAKDRLKIANTDIRDLVNGYLNGDEYFKRCFRLWTGNTKLLVSCRAISENDLYDEDEIKPIIMTALKDKLREMNVLRVVK